MDLICGNNVVNAALELAAMLSGDVARVDYVQAENPEAEKCVRYTTEDGYWVELAVMPLARGRLSQAVIDLVADRGPRYPESLFGILWSEYSGLMQGVTSEEVLREEYLSPLWKQGLITETSGGDVVGPQSG